jgi:hypothetical protein
MDVNDGVTQFKALGAHECAKGGHDTPYHPGEDMGFYLIMHN